VWHIEAITTAVEKVLGLLGRAEPLQSFYLAGGTGLALHLGHRRSIDLDFFSEQLFDEERFLDRLQTVARVSVIARARHTLHFQIDGVKVSFLGYPYPAIFPFTPLEGVPVADPRDIACMKISAIAGHGTRRDCVDLFVVARQHDLGYLPELFQKKYATVHYNRVHLLKSLTYFDDAEREPQPDLLIPLSWDDVTQFFRQEVARLSRA
jgi:hypothetical protein